MGATPLVEVEDGVMTGFGGVVLGPVLLKDTAGVIFIIIRLFLKNVFYLHDVCEQ